MSASEQKKRELKLKDHVSARVYQCLAQFYRTGRFGYLTMIGGEAINAYLDKSDKLETGDFDLKFVVNPEYVGSEEDRLRANSLRLRLAYRLIECLKGIEPPSGYTEMYPKLGILIRNQFHLIYLEDGKMFYVDNYTGEEKFTRYKTNKTFKIKLYYRHGKGDLQEFDLVDLGLFYRKELAFSFFEDQIYDTFLEKPFNKKNPIPFVVRNQVRIPTLPFLLFDNFRMILISLDNLSIFRDNPELLEFWENKLKKYWIKVDKMMDVFMRKNPHKKVNELEDQMRHTYRLYKPLAYFNMICHREGYNYVKTVIDREECDENYQKELKSFEEAYYSVAERVAKLRF